MSIAKHNALTTKVKELTESVYFNLYSKERIP